mmetsp:Transcript_18687/g.16552  ORF Transcript_18687/g.16552 Transcript_18687/m.16552 type:complete len:133 (+) Transcript_18687:21-419(+)
MISNRFINSRILSRAFKLQPKNYLPLYQNPYLHNLPVRSISTYKPKIQMIFSKNGEFHLYHYERGENMIRLLSRINVAFLCGNSILLALELASPFFGYWHGVSLCLGIGASFMYGGMLHYYSTRIIKNIYLK